MQPVNGAHDQGGAAVQAAKRFMNQPSVLGVQAARFHVHPEIGARLLAFGGECVGERLFLSTVHSPMLWA